MNHLVAGREAQQQEAANVRMYGRRSASEALSNRTLLTKGQHTSARRIPGHLGTPPSSPLGCTRPFAVLRTCLTQRLGGVVVAT